MFKLEEEKMPEPHVKFVSYSGRYPNLCSGVLVLNIDGNDVSFGNKFIASCRDRINVDYDDFWRSGGGIDDDCDPIQREWIIEYENIPEKFKKYAEEIDFVFNQNVSWGCCGGCG